MELPPPRLLVFNCHEAWVHQLGYLGYDLDIVDGLPGRYCSRWDTGVRPVPGMARLVNLKDVVEDGNPYHCLIAHNITDLLDLKMISGPRILVFHNTLEGLTRQHGLDKGSGRTERPDPEVSWKRSEGTASPYPL